jgi:3-methylfumaryl-CoA hydratase
MSAISEMDALRLEDWIGRTETLNDVVTAAPVAAMAATLDNGNAVPDAGGPLPPLWHWLYFLPRPKRSEIGPDGHAARGGFLPPVPLPRRMWAGGRLAWHDAIRVGDAIERVSKVASVSQKSGKTGDLVFVLVEHRVSTERGLALTEEHDIVYREAPQPGATPLAPPRAPTDEAWSERIEPDDVLLFRYSALTFNGHRIHYDRRYVTEVEGYPGLIVHGPLIATLLAELLRKHRSDATLASFSFRAISPLFDIAPFEVCGRPDADGKTVQLWARNADGGLAMQATAMLG